MIVKNIKDLRENSIEWGNGISTRFLLEKDNLGFTVTHTTINAGSVSKMEYKNHLEACYCIDGEGEVEDEFGNKQIISEGVLYALDKHDKHILRAKTALKLICFFTPALTGNEKHELSKTGFSSY
ncbi:MAG: hypothetical protein ACD_11C00002G0004 [uncultured bacterium]|nr:MAG: hypothetical protein ACD_11C00002G0004 [uncultured bacterium]